jgi:membrane protease YdiL (CAAX protease family)
MSRGRYCSFVAMYLAATAFPPGGFTVLAASLVTLATIDRNEPATRMPARDAWRSGASVGLLLMLASGFVSVLGGVLLDSLGPDVAARHVMAVKQCHAGPLPLVELLAVVAVVGPVVEEVFFRGIVLAWLARRVGPALALTLSSLTFATAHPEPFGKVVFALGVGIVYLRTRRLVVPIAIRAAMNVVVVALGLAGVGSALHGLAVWDVAMLATVAFAWYVHTLRSRAMPVHG